MLARKLSAFVRSIIHDRRGVAAVFLAVSLVPVIGGVGLAIDSALGYLVKTRMGKSLDAAGLAAGRIALDGNAEAVARAYFDANFGPGGRSVELTDFDFELDPTLHFVTLTAQATTPTFFMRIFGRDEMTVSARTVIQRETTGMELALVLDNTGSMQDDDKFETMQDAALDLVDILYGKDDEIENLWVSVVPFVTTVNIGTANKGWIKTSDRVYTNPTSWGTPNSWKGCVLARATPLDTDDTPPSGSKFSSFRWASPPSGSSRNYTCPSAILPLSPSRTKVDAALKAMSAAPKAGGTATNYGLVWGWRTLSPRWRGQWSGAPAALPLDYDTPQMEKVAVVLTDGENQLVYDHYTSYGFPSDLGYKKTADSTDMLNARMTTVCDSMKAKKIRVFTILFGKGHDKKAKDLLKSCATSEAMYYEAVTNADLEKAFKAIGGQLANLRILE